MHSKPKELATRHAILIVHKDHDKIAQLSLLLEEKGFLCLYAKSGLEAFKMFQLEKDGIKTLMVQENNLPINAYKTIDYIKNELNEHPYSVILQESEGDEVSDSRKLALADRFYILGGDFNSLLQDISGNEEQLFTDPTNSFYSLGYLKEISDSNIEFIEESLQLFASSVAKDIRDLYFKIKNCQYEEVRKIAHKIKPSFAMLENDKGVEICDQITYKAKDAELKNVIGDLYAEFERIKHELQTDYPNLNL